MRYIKGEYAVYAGKRQAYLQGDGALWYWYNNGYFVNKYDTLINPSPNYFDTIVDGIHFSTKVESHPRRILFMLPETHFLFTFPILARSMYYEMAEEEREILNKFATSVIYDIIKAKLNIDI